MKLWDVFKKAFWSERLDKLCDGVDSLAKATRDGLILHGQATCGLPPKLPEDAEPPKPQPAPEAEKPKPAAPAPKAPGGPG